MPHCDRPLASTTQGNEAGRVMHRTYTQHTKEGHTHLSDMKIVKVLKKRQTTYLDTFVSLGEDSGNMESLPSIIKKVLEENKDVMPAKLPETASLARDILQDRAKGQSLSTCTCTLLHGSTCIRGSKETLEVAPRGQSHPFILPKFWCPNAIIEENKWVIALTHGLSGAL